jgi:hypothetical protein
MDLDNPGDAPQDAGSFLAGAGTVASVCFAVAGTIGLIMFVGHVLAQPRAYTTPQNILLHYIFPAAVVSCSFGALKLRTLYRIRCLTLCAAVVASAYMLELVALAFFIDRPLPALAKLWKIRDKDAYANALTRAFGNHIDTRIAEEVMASMRRTDAEAIPIITPSNHLFLEKPDGTISSKASINGVEVMPLAGASLRTTLLCNESGEWISYRADRRGFNNPSGVWDLGSFDIAALGDSFAHGYCVPPGKSFVDLIRQQHPRTINLGIAGDGPLLMLATESQYLPALRPKVVLWFYFEGNDLEDLQRERRSALLMRYLDEGFVQESLARQHEVNQAILAEVPNLEALAAEQAKSVERAQRPLTRMTGSMLSVAKLTALRQRLGLLSQPETHERQVVADFQQANLDVFRRILTEAKRRAERDGGELQFVYLPDWERFTRRFRTLGDTKRDDVLRIVSELGIPIIDAEPAFRAHGDPLSLFPFREAGHYTEAGHRLVAQEVLGRLQASPALRRASNVTLAPRKAEHQNNGGSTPDTFHQAAPSRRIHRGGQ